MAKGWYVVHTYTGYEQKIERIINKLRASDGEFAAYCTGVNVPMESVTVQNEKGETKIEHKKVIPGYILVELDLLAHIEVLLGPEDLLLGHLARAAQDIAMLFRGKRLRRDLP